VCVRRLLTIGILWASVPGPLAAEMQVQESVVEIDGRPVRVLCTAGPRRVVLVHGESSGAESWRPVLDVLAGRVGACAYDRIPVSEGGPEEGRGWFALMDEMWRTHPALGFERGYVLVGHAMGGLYARLYAADRPLDVGGLVLLDPVHEDMPEEARPGMPRAAWSAWMAERIRPNTDGMRESDLARHARNVRLPDIPVTVLTATERRDGDGWDARFLAQAARRVHASILHGVRSGRHIPASGAGPLLPSEDPELVAREIMRVAGMTTRGER